jgi:hypothetical protein
MGKMMSYRLLPFYQVHSVDYFDSETLPCLKPFMKKGLLTQLLVLSRRVHRNFVFTERIQHLNAHYTRMSVTYLLQRVLTITRRLNFVKLCLCIYFLRVKLTHEHLYDLNLMKNFKNWLRVQNFKCEICGSAIDRWISPFYQLVKSIIFLH